MAVRCMLALCLVFCSAGAAFGQGVPPNPDETAVRELVRHYVDARNSRDPDAIRSFFASDADQLVSTGEWRKGIDAVVEGAVASSRKENAKSSITIESIRFLDRDVAIADGRYETVSARTGESRKMWATVVAKRVGDEWRIAAIRNMLPSTH